MPPKDIGNEFSTLLIHPHSLSPYEAAKGILTEKLEKSTYILGPRHVLLKEDHRRVLQEALESQESELSYSYSPFAGRKVIEQDPTVNMKR